MNDLGRGWRLVVILSEHTIYVVGVVLLPLEVLCAPRETELPLRWLLIL